jgi:hypothetical protein
MTMRYYYVHLLEKPNSSTLTTPNAGEDIKHQELSFIAGGNAKWWPLWKTA